MKKRIISVLIVFAILLPMAIGNLVLPASAASPATGKYVITGGGSAGAPDYALNTETYTGAELGTMLASTEAPDTGISFENDLTAAASNGSYVIELIAVEGTSNYAIRLASGRYLAAAGTTNLVSYQNYFGTTEAQWTVDVLEDGSWKITNAKSPSKYLAFSEQAHYFRTFTSGGTLPVLYSFETEAEAAAYTVSLLQSDRGTGAGSITATYNGSQYVFTGNPDADVPATAFDVAAGSRVTLYFEAAEGSALSKVRVNGVEQDLIPSGSGYSLILNNISGSTNVTAVFVNGNIDNPGDAATAVTAPYDNSEYGLEGEGRSDPLTTAMVNTADILEGSLFTDKSVRYNPDEETFTNMLSLNSVAFETATSESVVIPMDVVIVVDISGSMSNTNPTRISKVVPELNLLLNNIISASSENRIGIVTFSGSTSSGSNKASNAAIDVPLAKYTSVSASVNGSSLTISASGRNNVTKNVTGGTYTQTGIGKGYEAFQAVTDRTVTVNGQEYDRTPVMILMTDGCPTWGSSNYTASSPGNSTTGNGSEGTNMTDSCYYSILAGHYFRGQIQSLYNNNDRMRFYTIGVDTASGTYASLAKVVLDPTSANISAMTGNNDPYAALRTRLQNSAYTDNYRVNGEYVSYADKSYDCSTTTNGLQDAFNDILSEAQAVITHVQPVVKNSSVDFYDALGADMEFKSDPVLTYNGRTYTPTATVSGGKTYYHFSGMVQPYDGSPMVSLEGMTAVKEKDADGIWTLRWSIPDSLVPAYVYDQARDAYIPAETAILSYDVAPTEEALRAVTSPRTFYSNLHDDGTHHADVTYYLNEDSPYYKTYYGSLDPVLEHDKQENNSGTDPYIGYTEQEDGLVTKQLGNNGSLTVSAKLADITVKKLWKNPDGTVIEAPEGASVVAQLWKKTDGTTDSLVEEVTLNAGNNWQYTWTELLLRDEEHTYSYFGKEIRVNGAPDFDYKTVEEPDENGELRVSNYYNRMTITVNTDWYYNGVEETDTISNSTVNTLYYRDSTGELVPVPGVNPIIFDSTDGKSEDWNDVWSGLPIFNADGTPIEYIVVQEIVNEDPRGDHTTFYTVENNPRDPECGPITGNVNPNPVVQIDNYLENPPISVTVNKIWADGNPRDIQEIIVSLYRTPTYDGQGSLVETVTLSDENGWTHTFPELAPGYYYYVRESKVPGYTASYSAPVCQKDDGNTPEVTITNTPYNPSLPGGLNIEKLWTTPSGTMLLDAGNMPEIKARIIQHEFELIPVEQYTVTFNFVARTVNYETNHDVASSKTVTVDAGGTATLNFTDFNNLRLSTNSSTVTVTSTGTGTLHNNLVSNVSNSRLSYTGSISVSDVRSNITVTVRSTNLYYVWAGGIRYNYASFDNQGAALTAEGGDEPERVFLNSATYRTVSLNAANDWHVSVVGLPTTSQDGHVYTYTVEEQTTSFVPIYSENNEGYGVVSGNLSITNTIHPEILPDSFVYDFGLPMDLEVLDNDSKSLNITGLRLTGVSSTAPEGVELNTGVSTSKRFGSSAAGTYGRFSVLKNTLRYNVSSTNVPGIDSVYYEIYVPGVGYMYSAVDVAPASNVYFEESFLANNGFEVLGAAETRAQSAANILYGNDAAYAAYEQNSLGRCYAASVSDPLDQPTATFTFTGTGFDIVSRCTPDSGVMLVYVRRAADDSIVKYFITDNYLAEDSLYQLPVVHCTGLTYGTYFIEVKAYYNAAFDHNLSRRSPLKTEEILRSLGIPADADVTVTLAENGPAKRLVDAEEGTYNVYIDGVRIYSPLDELRGPAQTLYTTAHELDWDYIQLRQLLLDAKTFNKDNSELVNAVLYIADNTSNTGISESYLSTGIYLSSSGKLNTEEKDGVTYLLDKDNNRIQYMGEDVSITVEGTTRKYFHGGTEMTQQQVNTLQICYYDTVYELKSPQNEVYLKDGSGIAFAVNENSGLQVSAKSPSTRPVTLCVYDGAKWVGVAEITSATEMFFDLTPYTRGQSTVMIKCASDEDGILSLCQVKTLGIESATRGLHLTDKTVYEALRVVDSNPATVMPHDHEWVCAATTATCTLDGTETQVCSVCGETRACGGRAVGHHYSVKVTPAVGCVSNGSMVFTCADCGKQIVRVLPSARHSFKSETVDGSIVLTCTECGFRVEGGKPAVDPCAGYTDVDTAMWYHTAVDYVIDRDLMGSTRTDARTFEPGTACTRAMVVSVLYRLAGSPAVETAAAFTDVPAGSWYTDAVCWAYANGIVAGYGNGSFGPNDKITREQLAVILCAYAEKIAGVDTATDAELSVYTDGSTLTWSAAAMRWAVSAGVISGKTSGGKLKLDPKATATRQEIASVLMRFEAACADGIPE